MSYTVEVKGIDEVRAMLSDIKGGANKAISRALNKTVKSAESISAKKTVEKFNVAQKTVKQDFKKFTSHSNYLIAKLESKGKPVPLGKTLRARQTQKGVSVQVKKDKGRKLIPHAFIIKVGKGQHRGIFIREYVKEAGYKPSTRKFQKKGFYAHLPKKYRYKIKELFTSRVPDIFGNDNVIIPVLEESSEILEKNMSHEADWVLESAR